MNVDLGPVRRDHPESGQLQHSGAQSAEVLGSLIPSLEEFMFYCHSWRKVEGEWVDKSEDVVARSDDEWGAEIDWA